MVAADELIAQGKLNEALLLLKDYAVRQPENFDQVQRRINKIFRLRASYTNLAENLLNVIVDDPLNDAKKLKLISGIENFANDPSDSEKAFIADVKSAANFTYHRAMFDRIMEDGSRLLTQQRFAESAKRFSEGLSLYRSDFYEKFADTALLAETDRALTDIETSIYAYDSMQSRLAAIFRRFNYALSIYDIDSAIEAYKVLEETANEYAALRNAQRQAGLQFKNNFEELRKKDALLTEASFLPFAYRFILGRESDPNTGIVRVMDVQWEALCKESYTLLTSAVTRYSLPLASALSARDAERAFSAAERAGTLGKLVKVADVGSRFADLRTLFETSGETVFPAHDLYHAAFDYNTFLVQQTQNLVEQKKSIAEGKNAYTALSMPSDIDRKNDELIAYSNSLTAYAQSAVEISHTNTDNIRELHLRRESFQKDDMQGRVKNFALPPWEPLYAALNKALRAQNEENTSQIIKSWESLSSFIGSASSAVKQKYTGSFDETRAYINESLDTAVSSNPEKALADFGQLKKELKADIASLRVRRDLLAQAPDEPLYEEPGSDLFLSNLKAAAADIDFLNALDKNIDSSIALAQRRVNSAQQAKNEGDFRFSQARTALQREDFDASRTALQQARDKYNESLKYQDSASLRDQTDKKLNALGLEIVRLENAKVVQDVRRLLTSARALYSAGSFEQAEALILQAEGRWAVTNTDQNGEIVNLKILIGSALSIRTGRTIPVTDPLYPEMSQTLNVAYQYFDQGSRAFKKGNRREGISVLNSARERIKNVQVLYPLNQEANLLSLRISQLINPGDFEELFKQRYAAARKEYRNPATVSRAYADLKDLYEIDPSYPGLKRFIYDVEVELGIIVLPPDPKKVARSRELVREVNRIYESSSRDEITLNNALSKLDEALALYPENTEAMVLADRIKTRMGGRSLVVLPADKELLYQQAVQELAKGNTITAASIVANLWQDPKLRNSAKIIDLKKKVDSLL